MPWVCSVTDFKRCQNVVRTLVMYSAVPCTTFLWFSCYILTSSVIYHWKVTQQSEVRCGFLIHYVIKTGRPFHSNFFGIYLCITRRNFFNLLLNDCIYVWCSSISIPSTKFHLQYDCWYFPWPHNPVYSL